MHCEAVDQCYLVVCSADVNPFEILFSGLANVTAPCKAGYYCARGSWMEDPTDGITGDICPPGRYCGMHFLLQLLFSASLKSRLDKKKESHLFKKEEIKKSLMFV